MSICFSVEYESFTSIVREPDEDDKWDRGDRDTSWVIGNTFSKSKYADLVLKEEPELDSEWWVVYATYSTGDTFGIDGCSEIEWLGLYDTLEKAKNVVKSINNRDKDITKLSYQDNYGNVINRGYCPWDGYFESLCGVDYSLVRYVGG